MAAEHNHYWLRRNTVTSKRLQDKPSEDSKHLPPIVPDGTSCENRTGRIIQKHAMIQWNSYDDCRRHTKVSQCLP